MPSKTEIGTWRSSCPGHGSWSSRDGTISPWVGDVEPFVGEIEEFLTGTRGASEVDRVLATVLFTDVVGSTERPKSSATAAGGIFSRAFRYTVIRRAVHIHPTVSELVPTMLGELQPLAGPS